MRCGATGQEIKTSRYATHAVRWSKSCTASVWSCAGRAPTPMSCSRSSLLSQARNSCGTRESGARQCGEVSGGGCKPMCIHAECACESAGVRASLLHDGLPHIAVLSCKPLGLTMHCVSLHGLQTQSCTTTFNHTETHAFTLPPAKDLHREGACAAEIGRCMWRL